MHGLLAYTAGHKINYPDLGIGTNERNQMSKLEHRHKINYPDLGIGTDRGSHKSGL